MGAQSDRTEASPAAPDVLTEITLRAEDRFLRGKLLKFIGNLLRVQKAPLPQHDRDICEFLGEMLSRADVTALVRQTCSPELLDEIGHAEKNRRQRMLELLDGVIPEPNDRAGLNLERDSVEEIIRLVWNHRRTHQSFKPILLAAIQRQAAAFADQAQRLATPTLLQSKFTELVRFFGLDEQESDLLLLAYARHSETWTPFPEGRGRPVRSDRLQILSACLHIPLASCARRLAETARLQKYNCLNKVFDFNDDLDAFLSGLSTEPLVSNFFTRCTEPPLPWSNFGKLAQEQGAMLKDLLSARPPDQGLHILLYGQAGTGKTSFATALAAELGLDLYRIKKGDESRPNANCNSRTVSLNICAEQVDSARSLILIDEADKMLISAGGLLAAFLDEPANTGDKGVINTLMDNLKVACIWITNTPPDNLHPSIRRRFDYSIRFDDLSRQQRCAVWQNCVGRYDLKNVIDDTLLATLAERFAVNAGGIDLALRNCARILKHQAAVPPGDLLEKLLQPHCQLLEIPPARTAFATARGYTLEGLNVRGPALPAQILDAVRRFRKQQETGLRPGPDVPRMNVLLYGPPGTGKTEFVKYLGHTLDCPVLTRMGSDLLDKYVGGTEKNICRAFREAEAERAILFIDEAEGMLHSRDMAHQSWEITQVNELLRAMENFDGVLICSTNAYGLLDPATLRRFTFKLEFDYLEPAGKVQFYTHFFAELCAGPLSNRQQHQLEKIDNLTPGDFRTVRQSLGYLGPDQFTPAAILAALEQESVAKQHQHPGGHRFGFQWPK